MSQRTLLILALFAIFVLCNAGITGTSAGANKLDNSLLHKKDSSSSSLIAKNGKLMPRKKDHKYLWPLGLAIAGVAATVFGIFIKIIWSVSMLSTMMSAASIILSGIFSLGGSHAHRRNEPISEHYAADKRLDSNHFLHTILNAANYQDFTTEYSKYIGQSANQF